MLINECRNELENHIIPFWNKLEDKEYGGFYGFLSKDDILNPDKKAIKGVILHSRILWFYSNAYTTVGGEENLRLARHAYEFVKKCVDKQNGGVYWMMNYDGTPADTMKHTYNQAFCIYALSSFYEASKDQSALDLAFEIFNTIESKTRDEFGYMEAFSADWKLIPNDALSENGLMADKTMNTVLHLLEAYTELLRVTGFKPAEERLRALLDTVKNKIFDSDRDALKVFFDKEFNEIGDIYSFGHDIEAAWLTDRACEVIGDEALIEEFKNIDLRIAHKIYDVAFDGKALNNESEHGIVDTTRIWWVQAEAMVGFINAYQKCGDKKFLEAAKTIWEYIKDNIIDKREGGEWYWNVDINGVPHQGQVVGPWKCPYHNGRMCFEVIKRNVK